mmetsp:Transcript_35393/g.112907  ORF Transcript_35393/g.112907 Transcript_35393/m.112907 type:complete len:139 (-) Transcript_35393:449-865(-)
MFSDRLTPSPTHPSRLSSEPRNLHRSSVLKLHLRIWNRKVVAQSYGAVGSMCVMAMEMEVNIPRRRRKQTSLDIPGAFRGKRAKRKARGKEQLRQPEESGLRPRFSRSRMPGLGALPPIRTVFFTRKSIRAPVCLRYS